MLQSEEALVRWRPAEDLDREDVATAILDSAWTSLWLGGGPYSITQVREEENAMGDAAFFHVEMRELVHLGPGDGDLKYDAWDTCTPRGGTFKRSLFLRFEAFAKKSNFPRVPGAIHGRRESAFLSRVAGPRCSAYKRRRRRSLRSRSRVREEVGRRKVGQNRDRGGVCERYRRVETKATRG